MLIFDDFPCTKMSSKYFVGYNNNEKVTPLCIWLPKMSGYLKNIDVLMFFLVEDENYWKNMIKYEEVMKRKKFDSGPVFSDKYLKTKVKSYNNKITTSFLW